MLVYATAEDVTAWDGTLALPPNVDALLRSASLLVRGATKTARYDTTSGGLPSDPDTVAVFRDATAAQVASWVTLGLNPAGGGIDARPPVQSKKIATGAISYDTSGAASVTAQQARADATSTLCTDALAVLADAGLLSDQPTIYG